jgi:hypothetical protein
MNDRHDIEDFEDLLGPSSPVAPHSPRAARWIDDSELIERTDDDLPNNPVHPVQWSTPDQRRFVPATKAQTLLPAGVYEIQYDPSHGVYFERLPVQSAGLLRFPNSSSDQVLCEIQSFWSKEELFRVHGLPYKRGILLWGPPGNGKSCLIRLILDDLVGRAGLAFRFAAPPLFKTGMRAFREIQPDTPVVVLMEDFDTIVAVYPESEVLDLLDGMAQVHKTVFLATTNYPERLSPRILNRPSRFDRRFKIDYPDADARRKYLHHLAAQRKGAEAGFALDQWVHDTERCSLAHLKELFVAVAVLGNDYAEAVKKLRSMGESISSEDDDRPMGLAGFRPSASG